ncbi:uncharacterized protein LOC120132015 [Hibiscus syriacus]|uniref:uncharacterized protein LOC120132015 n=1 Tax=Hibiscus syriacus TaxID=106335 RepID=UPI001922C58E|nr:uncharacterized protein LOC120132015 [Hibiscus syriacus]
MKLQYDKLMVIVSRFGGIVQMESFINHSIRINSELLRLQPKQDKELEAMSHKHGGMENMGSIVLVKLKNMVAESRKVNEMKSKLGIQETESIVEKYKEMEVELQGLKQKLHNQKELESFPFPLSPGSRQQKDMYEGQVEDFKRFEELMSKFGGIDKMEYMLDKFPEMEIELSSRKQREEQLQLQKESPGPGSLQIGTMIELQYSDVVVDQLIQSLADDNVPSKSDDLDSFDNLLDGDREIVGKYKIPTPLVSTAQNIFNVYGDITRKSKFSVHAVQNIFVLFCAAIKEMSDRSLELVTEEIIWKLRDPIMDAKRSEFDVEFAMEYLKTIAQGYFGLKARSDCDNLKQAVACLRAEEEALIQELEKKSQEIKEKETKQRCLASEKCRICREYANKIMCKTISIF